MLGDVLAELAVKIQADTKDLEKGLNDVDKKLKKSAVDYKKVGLGMMAVGTAAGAGLIAAANAAEKERVGIQKLSAVMRNAGVEYDNVKDSLESLILTQQMKTGIADDQQREALQALIFATGDYQKSLDNLNLVMDLSVAKDMDIATAAELVGKVIQGEFGTLSRYGIILKEDATEADALAAIQKRVAGSAEAARSPIEVLKARMGDLSETIGSALIPKLTELLDKHIIPIVDKIVVWIEKNPQLITTLMAIAAVVGVGGALLVGLSMVSKAIMAINTALIIMQSLSGVGILKVLGGLAIAAGAIYGMNQLMNQGTSGVPGMASGGIVTSPTLAMIGEAGPEAVIPLREMGGAQTINLYIDGEQVTNVIEKRINNRVRLQEVSTY